MVVAKRGLQQRRTRYGTDHPDHPTTSITLVYSQSMRRKMTNSTVATTTIRPSANG